MRIALDSRCEFRGNANSEKKTAGQVTAVSRVGTLCTVHRCIMSDFNIKLKTAVEFSHSAAAFTSQWTRVTPQKKPPEPMHLV